MMLNANLDNILLNSYYLGCVIIELFDFYIPEVAGNFKIMANKYP